MKNAYKKIEKSTNHPLQKTPPLKMIFLFLTVFILAHFYVAGSIFLTLNSVWVWIVLSLLFSCTLINPYCSFKLRKVQWETLSVLSKNILLRLRVFSLLCLGLFSLLFTGSVVRDLIGAVARLSGAGPSFTIYSIWIEIAIIVLVMIYGVFQALKGPQISEVEILLPQLPDVFEGFKIVQISDLHIGPTIRHAYVHQVVCKVHQFQPDLIVMTGDIVDGSLSELQWIAQKLGDLRAPYGVVMVTGNHEYYWNAQEWIDFFKAQKIQVLFNEHILLQKEGQSIAILGVPDTMGSSFISSHKVDLHQATQGLASEIVKILLAHQPRPSEVQKAHKLGVHLQLSGHTHGGQYFPFNWIIYGFQKYVRGLYRFQEMWIYVNRGTGFWGPPLRAGASSELTVLKLSKAGAGGSWPARTT